MNLNDNQKQQIANLIDECATFNWTQPVTLVMRISSDDTPELRRLERYVGCKTTVSESGNRYYMAVRKEDVLRRLFTDILPYVDRYHEFLVAVLEYYDTYTIEDAREAMMRVELERGHVQE